MPERRPPATLGRHHGRADNAGRRGPEASCNGRPRVGDGQEFLLVAPEVTPPSPAARREVAMRILTERARLRRQALRLLCPDAQIREIWRAESRRRGKGRADRSAAVVVVR